MRQELYIDGQLMDVTEKTDITITLQSNFLRDVGEIAGNSTYTIQLPLTARNRAVIDAADIVPRQSSFPYYKHTAKYIRDGVVIIDNGIAVVVSIEDNIEILITWGINSALTNLIGDGAKLTDIPVIASVYYPQIAANFKWLTLIADAQNYPFFYASADYNDPLEDPVHWQNVNAHGWQWKDLRPIVRVYWILQQIEQQYGVTFSFPAECNDMLARLCIPLIKDAPTAATLTNDTIQITGYAGHMSINYGLYLNMTNDGAGNVLDVASTPTETLTTSVNTAITIHADFAYYYQRNNPNDTDYIREFVAVGGCLRVIVEDANGDYNTDETTTIPFTYEVVNPTTTKIICKGETNVDLQVGEKLRMSYSSPAILYAAEVKDILQNFVPISIYVTGQQDHVNLNSYYPIVNNLPDITIVEFLRTLFVLLGVWVKNTQGTTITMENFSALWDNKANAVDWTRKVIPSHNVDRPQRIAYALEEWAQENHYNYKSVETTQGEFNGTLSIRNETLEKERDVVTLPFTICKLSSQGRARMPLYKLNNYGKLVDGTETTPTFDIQDYDDVICTASPYRTRSFGGGGGIDANTIMQIGHDGMRLQDILGERYGEITTALNSATIIEENVRLNDYELSIFDETKPVYLQQYGRFFGVLQIEAQSDGVAKVKLLTL